MNYLGIWEGELDLKTQSKKALSNEAACQECLTLILNFFK